MFIEVFEKLCDKKGKSPTTACLEMGLSNASYSHWKKTGAIPFRSTLKKIADYFGVSVEYLTADNPEQNTAPSPSPALFSEKEIALIFAYRARKDMQLAVDTLLGLRSQSLAEDVAKEIEKTKNFANIDAK